MLKYIVIPLSHDVISFCSYSFNSSMKNEIAPDVLSKAICWAMKENLFIQFVYPINKISDNIRNVVSSIEHVDIVPSDCKDDLLLRTAQVVVFNTCHKMRDFQFRRDASYILRTTLFELIDNVDALKKAIRLVDRINITLLDIPTLTECDLNQYELILNSLIPQVFNEYKQGYNVELNILTDRIFLSGMNNCGAGELSVSMDLDGNLFACPAFEGNVDKIIGNINSRWSNIFSSKVNITKSPICRICDAWQCKRCIWLNYTLTEELNIPSYQQCIISHIERKASSQLLNLLKEHDTDKYGKYSIKTINYLDPFELVKK